MKILILRFKRLRNEAHYEFMVIVLALLNKFPSVKAIVIALFPKFTQLLEKERLLVDATRKSPLTEKLIDADKRIDRDITAIRETVKVAMNHYIASTADAAKQLNIRLKDFGNMREKPYEEESAAVQLLVNDLKTTYASQAQIVGITSWVTELSDAENLFTTLFEQRNVEESNRPQGNMIDVRKEIDEVYKMMIISIQNNLNTTGETTCGKFVLELNEDIKYFNEHIHHRTKHSVTETTVSVIPDQAYTGRQITFIPEVWYGHKQLVFATDFTVTYRNNINPGNAELIIHGKGDFKGSKTVTFNITERISRIEN